MAAYFRRIDSNTAAVILDGGQAAATLCAIDTLSGAVASSILPASWLAPLRVTLKRLIEVTQPAERLSADFARLLLSVVDADGGADSAINVSVSGAVLTVGFTGPANATTLVSLTRSGASVKAAPAAAGGASVNLAPYALKTEIPSLTAYALKAELPNIAGLLSESNAVATYATKAALAEVAGFAPERTLYVAKNGNDSMGNGSYGKPFLSIGRALEAANGVSGGYVRINVGPGEYAENVTISRARTILAGSGVDPEDHTTSLMGSLTVDCSAATQRYNDVVAVQGFYVNNGAKVTGTGGFMAVFTDCYLTTGDAGTNAVLVDNTHASRTIVYLRNCTVTKQNSATTDVVKLSRGDVRMDTVRVYGAVSGPGNGILLNNNATLSADRLQVDINMEGAALRIDGSYAGIAATLSNTGLKTNYKGSGAAPALYLKNDTGIGAFLWQVMLMAADTATGKYAIDGVYNGNALTPPFLYGHVTFGTGTNTTLVAALSAMKSSLKMTDL